MRIAEAFYMFLEYFMPNKVLCGQELITIARTMVRKLAKWL